MQPTKRPALAQEILDLIIDMIALDVSGPSEHTLRTCSLVSTAFKDQCRKHLFSEIEFVADEHAQRRAKRLFKILSRQSNQRLILDILSFRLIVDIPEKVRRRLQSIRVVTQLHIQAWKILRRTARKLDIGHNYLSDILELLSRSPLQRFAMEVRDWKLDWNDIGDYCALSSLFSIRSHPSLKFLSFVNVVNLDRSIIFVEKVGPCGGLQELQLWDVTMRNGSIPYQLSNAATRSLAGLEYLRIRTIVGGYSHIFPPCSSSTYFLCLRTLVVGIPIDIEDLPGLFEMIKNFAPTLATLEMQNIWWLGSNSPLEQSLLSDLPNLRDLKLRASYRRPVSCVSLEMMTHLLASPTSPLPIENISIELELPFYIIDGMPYIQWHQNEALKSAATLDRILTSTMLLNLRRLVFALKLDKHGSNFPRAYMFPQSFYPIDDTYVRQLLPNASAFPSIDFEDSIEICS